MGDRGNIMVVDTDLQKDPSIPQDKYFGVFLYSHWGGNDLPKTLAEGLERGRNRWDDTAYLTRIIFDTMTEGDQGETGYGISLAICDNQYAYLRVLTSFRNGGKVQLISDDPFNRNAVPLKEYTFQEFIDACKGKSFSDLEEEATKTN